jgi:hypothetical protein
VGEVVARKPSSDLGLANVDLGIDYGLATNKDLGISHTISFRILY